jgi:DNA polymerase-3 subunit epsilon
MLTQYSWWGGQNPPPSHLRTAKQLSQSNLIPRKAVGVIYGRAGHQINLYDPRDSQSVFTPSQFEAMKLRDRTLAKDWATAILQRDDWVILDTETTGLKAPEICQIAIINHQGEPVLDTLVRPTKPIEDDAIKIHGITNQLVEFAPSFSQVYPEILNAITCKEVLIYNASFDIGVLKHCSANYRSPLAMKNVTDFMLIYAQFVGEWSGYYNSYKYPKLQGNHSALGDCLKVLEIIQLMAT